MKEITEMLNAGNLIEDMTIRISSLRYLERYAIKKNKHQEVIELLEKYLKLYNYIGSPKNEEKSENKKLVRPNDDVQLALDLIIKLRENRPQIIKLDKLDLRGANLEGVNLERAIMMDSDLQYSNISNSKLDNAVLINCNLTKALAKGTSFFETYLHRAILLNTDLTGAIGLIKEQLCTVKSLNGAIGLEQKVFNDLRKACPKVLLPISES